MTRPHPRRRPVRFVVGLVAVGAVACGRVDDGGARSADPCVDTECTDADPSAAGSGGVGDGGGAAGSSGTSGSGGVAGGGGGATDCTGDASEPDEPIRLPGERPAHRTVAAACERDRPCNRVRTGAPDAVVCTSHLDCTEGDNGRCQAFGYECTYDACFTDGDCADDELCDCAGGQNGAHRCLPAECRVDADCPDGAWCSPSRSVMCANLGGPVGYYCRTPDDTCTSDEECAVACAFDPEQSSWHCTDSRCTVP
jgi:hypothetical protein